MRYQQRDARELKDSKEQREQKERKYENNNARLHEQLMGFKTLVNEEFETRRDKAADFRIMTSRSRFNLIRHMLSCAEKSKQDYEKLLQSQDMDFTTLKHLEIDSFDSLKKWAALIKSQSGTMLKLLHGEFNSLTPEIVSELNQVKKISHIIALLYSFANSCGDEFPAKRELLDLLEIVRPDYVYRPYRKLISILTSGYLGSNSRDSNRFSHSQNNRRNFDLERDSKNFVSNDKYNDSVNEQPQSNANESNDTNNYEQIIDDLNSQINDLKGELEAAYFRVNACEEEYERLQNESSKFALIDVLAKMNSKSSRKMLDQFAKSEKTLKELSASGFEIPPEIASVSLCVRLFMNTMRSLGVSPVHEAGDLIELSLDEAENYDYNGSDFKSDDEKKLVQVIDSGWKCGDIIFSRPNVVEC